MGVEEGCVREEREIWEGIEGSERARLRSESESESEEIGEQEEREGSMELCDAVEGVCGKVINRGGCRL